MTVLDLKDHPSIFCVADIHGDLLALVNALTLTKCVKFDSTVHAEAKACPVGASGTGVHDRDRYRDLRSHAKWTGKRNAIVMLGDMVDNRRSKGADVYGVCGHTGTQTTILQLLAELKRQARAAGGDIVCLLGNHDVENLLTPSTGFCSRYAPVRMRDASDVWKVCSNGAFTPAHVQKMRGLFAAVEWDIVALIANGSKPLALLLHGGMDVDVFGSMLVPIRSKKNLLTPAAANVARINGLFHRALDDDEAPRDRRFIDDNASRMPTWCRPDYNENTEALRSMFGTARMVKGHDIQERDSRGWRRPRCVLPTGRLDNTSNNSEFADGVLCKGDTAMGRAFHAPNGGAPRGKVTYTTLEVYLRRGRPHKRWHEKQVRL